MHSNKSYCFSFVLEKTVFPTSLTQKDWNCLLVYVFGFSHLNEHRFWHNFQKCLNPTCTYGLEKDTPHYLLDCHHNNSFRTDLTNSVKTFFVDFESLADSKKVEILLYGGSRCDDNKNNSILSASINYIKKTKRFD